jgi:hypothetical protein
LKNRALSLDDIEPSVELNFVHGREFAGTGADSLLARAEQTSSLSDGIQIEMIHSNIDSADH